MTGADAATSAVSELQAWCIRGLGAHVGEVVFPGWRTQHIQLIPPAVGVKPGSGFLTP